MGYQGVIIEESLSNKDLLQDLKIVKTKTEPVTEDHKTPWLKQWTLHTIEVPDNQIDSLAEKLSHSFDKEHSDWYADFKSDEYHYVIFPGKVFKVNPKHVEEYRPVVEHGLSLGIPIYQLDFSPDIINWQR